MKPIFPAVWLSICLLLSFHAEGVMAAGVQEKPAASAASKKPAPAKKASPVKKKPAVVKKRPPIASKTKPASEVVKTPLPSANLDLSLPKDMAEELKPVGTVPLPKHDGVLPQMFGDKASPFQLNGRLINNEMQLQRRNEERHEVEGAALEFEFKR
ncbi:translation initiation factor 2 [Pseudomonas sp. PB120]|uniref:translation initiation factor 2 n=1 Tax=Pseudomonas sp. PB120 TaxID=2494700 RepID=UPI0012FDBD50|nr:translation initiation factor 2 [Pseudomonas sp. PB120]MVV50364.1 translation initiation factor 2 [Pseudomonas sp. PB120]